MENTTKNLERENPPLQIFPHSYITNSNTCNSDEVQNATSTPKANISKSEASGFPTTFIQADTTSFKQVVQMLTGSQESTKQAAKPAGPTKTGIKKPGFKLHERRNSLKNLKIIPGIPLISSGFSPHQPLEMLSPSVLDLPKLVFSPVTPLNSDPFERSSTPSVEEKVIAEKGFHLHASSPITTPQGSEPQLLPLFPVTSPRVSGGASSKF